MSNLEKKLDALIDALGFDVDHQWDYGERRISRESAMLIINSPEYIASDIYLVTNGGVYDIDGSGMYLSRLKWPNSECKLTKREPVGAYDEINGCVLVPKEEYEELTLEG